MESMGKKKPRRPCRSGTPEFKAEIVGLCRRGDRSVGAGCQGLRTDGDRGAGLGEAGAGRRGRLPAESTEVPVGERPRGPFSSARSGSNPTGRTSSLRPAHPGAYPLPTPPHPQRDGGGSWEQAAYWTWLIWTCPFPFQSDGASRCRYPGPRRAVRIVRTPQRSAGPYRDTPRRPGTDNAPSPASSRHREIRTLRSNMS